MADVTLRPYQEKAAFDLRAAYAAGFKSLLAVMPTGAGKCLGKGTPVLMHNGTVKVVENVKIGDLVMGPDSGPRQVVNVGSGHEMLYRVMPVKGDPYVVNESHILSLRITPAKDRVTGGGRTYAGGEIANVGVLDYLAASNTFKHRAKGWRSGVDFPHVEVSDDLPPYLLGIWLGDGTARNCGITTPDAEIVATLEDYAARHGLFVRKEAGEGKCPIYYVTRGRHWPGRGHRTNPFKRELALLGLIQNKHIPRSYLINSRAMRLELLAGIMDTDGHMTHGGYDFISVSERFADDVCFLVRSLGMAAYKAPCQKTCTNNGFCGNYYRVSISGDCSVIPTRIARKRAPERRQKKSVLDTGISVEPIGEGEYYGFELRGPDRLFLLGDFTVTHNTVLFSYVSNGAYRKGKRVLVVAHRRELIRQASNKLRDAGVEHGIIAPGFTRTNHLVQVASIQTIGRRPTAFGMFDLIVVDEAHHSVAGQYMQLIAAQPQAKLLGVTATPERADGRGLGIAAGGVFDFMVMGPTVQELIDGGYLTPARVYAPQIRPDLAGIRIRAGDYEKGDLADAMDTPSITGDAVSHYERHVPGQPVIAFCVSVQHAKNVASTFQAAGWRAFSVDGSDDAEYRDRVINGLATGATQVLCTCDIVSEGLDVPAVSAVSLLRPTKSLGLYLQQAGRGLRPAPGKTHLTVLDHAGCSLVHGLPEQEREWSLIGREKKPPPPAIKQCPECFTIHKPAQVCPTCGHDYAAANGNTPGRELRQVEGDLMELSADMLRLQKTPLNQLLTGNESRVELHAIARARGYKAGWVHHVIATRRGGQAA